MNELEYKRKIIESGKVFDLRELNSFLHFASKKTICELNNELKDEWIKRGTLTYYAEDFLKYQNSPKIENTLEIFTLFKIYEALTVL